MHKHKWTNWVTYTQAMQHVGRRGTFDHIKEFQSRECLKCGFQKQREL